MGRHKVDRDQPVRSSQLAAEVAEGVGIDPRDARVFIEHLTAGIIRHLAAGRAVHVDGLGTLRPMVQSGITRVQTLTDWKGRKNRVAMERVVKVFFRKARLLKETLR